MSQHITDDMPLLSWLVEEPANAAWWWLFFLCKGTCFYFCVEWEDIAECAQLRVDGVEQF